MQISCDEHILYKSVVEPRYNFAPKPSFVINFAQIRWELRLIHLDVMVVRGYE